MWKILIILMLTMSANTAISGTTISKYKSYTGMNDIMLPSPPFENIYNYEQYRFEPIVLIDTKSQTLEYEAYIIVEPNIITKSNILEEAVKHWYTNEQKFNDIEFNLIEQSKSTIAGAQASYLIIESKGYGEKLVKDHLYRHHIYLFLTENNALAVIRLSRLKENDKPKSELWLQWKEFIASIKYFEPDSVGLSTAGHSENTRRYYSHTLNYDIILGDSRELNKWIIEDSADRSDTWKTKSGDISIEVSLTDDYDFYAAKKNEKFKQEAEAIEKGGAAFFEEQAGVELEYEKAEIAYSNKNVFYGYIEKSSSHSTLTLKSAYKKGRAIQIEFKASNEVFNNHKQDMFSWVRNIVILPD